VLSLRVAVIPEANGNSPIPFDVVAVGDKKLAQSIGALEASAWYAQKRQFQNDFPDSSKLQVSEWEWTPGQIVPQIGLTFPKKPVAVYAFAGYAAPGAHRLQLRPDQTATIQLREDGPRLLAAPASGGLPIPFLKK
jgi:type VI secretion system protein